MSRPERPHAGRLAEAYKRAADVYAELLNLDLDGLSAKSRKQVREARRLNHQLLTALVLAHATEAGDDSRPS